MNEHTKELIRELEAIRRSAKPYPSGACGQTIGQETWRIVLSGDSLQWITDAVERLIELEQQLSTLQELPASMPVLTVKCEPGYWSGGHYHEGTKPHIDPTAVWELPIGTKLYTAPPRLHMLISGAVYDFAGFLTTQEESLTVGARKNASPVADLLRIWADKRGLKLKGASILSWQDVITAPAQLRNRGVE